MSAGSGLLQAILAEPDKDDLRLIYADWLDEQGQEERAEFIRVQCALASWKPYQAPPEIAEIASSGRLYAQLAREILAANETEHVGRHNALQCRQADLLANARLTWEPDVLVGLMALQPETDWRWQRGFVEEVTLSCQHWLKYGPDLVRCQPIRWVRLSDKEATRVPPWFNPEQVGNYIWWWYTEDYQSPGGSDIPFDIWYCLGGTADIQGHKTWPTREEAEAALSAACLRWAKQQAQHMTPTPAPC